ncbi:MAG: zinc-ribbon domain-containing protein [Gemmataceae bacterium]|nr:zinc-ribbon domain-containing protein [Gemmataceae bacterium]
MSITVTCTGCAARIEAPDSAGGKKVKCRKCQAVTAVPSPMPATPAPAVFGVVEEPSDKPMTASAPRPVEQDDDDRPRRKKRRDADSSRSLNNERSKRKVGGSNTTLILRGVGGALVIFLLCGGFLLMIAAKKTVNNGESADGTEQAGAPESYQEIDNTAMLDLLDNPDKYRGRKLKLNIMPQLTGSDYVDRFAGRNLWFEGAVWYPNNQGFREYTILIKMPPKASDIPHQTGNQGVQLYIVFSGNLRQASRADYVKLSRLPMCE